MATLQQLIANLRTIRANFERRGPQLTAESMLRETQDNFTKQQYGNDNTPKRWADRVGFIGGRKVNAERYLRYPKLRYTGALLNSASTRYARNYASLSFAAPYAQDHNEGTLSGGSGSVIRRPPASSQRIMLGTRPMKRQFAGVGRRTYNNVHKIYSDFFKILT